MRNQELRGYPIPPQLDNTETLLLRVKELISNESLTKSQQSRYHRVDSEWKGNSPGVEGERWRGGIAIDFRGEEKW